MACGLDIQHGHIFRVNLRQALGEPTVLGFPYAAHKPENQVLAVRLKQERVFSLAKGGLDENVSQFGLKRRMKMEFGLLDSNQPFAGGQGCDQDRQNLAETEANVPMADNGPGPRLLK